MAYLLEELIDKLGFEDGDTQWTSDDHRKIAMVVLLGNRHVRSRDSLMECVKIINAIPQDQIRSITFEGMEALGIPIQQQ